jgi:FixJ family two-component response regulator
VAEVSKVRRGLELASQIRTVRPDIPVILFSGYSSAALERDEKATGVSDELRKPLRQAYLARALSRALSRQDNETHQNPWYDPS